MTRSKAFPVLDLNLVHRHQLLEPKLTRFPKIGLAYRLRDALSITEQVWAYACRADMLCPINFGGLGHKQSFRVLANGGPMPTASHIMGFTPVAPRPTGVQYGHLIDNPTGLPAMIIPPFSPRSLSQKRSRMRYFYRSRGRTCAKPNSFTRRVRRPDSSRSAF